MTQEKFRHGLDLWGSDLSRWPDSDRQAAQDLLDRDDAARRELRTSQAMDAFFCANDPGRAASDDAVQRLMSGVTARLNAATSPTLHTSCQEQRGLMAKITAILGDMSDWGQWVPRFAASTAMAAALGIYVGGWWSAETAASTQSAADLLAMIDYSSLMGL